MANVIVRNQGNVEVTFNLPMKDFGTTFERTMAVDPKLLEQQGKGCRSSLRSGRRNSARSSSSSSRPRRPQPRTPRRPRLRRDPGK